MNKHPPRGQELEVAIIAAKSFARVLPLAVMSEAYPRTLALVMFP
jgi:hypothetical protein